MYYLNTRTYIKLTPLEFKKKLLIIPIFIKKSIENTKSIFFPLNFSRDVNEEEKLLFLENLLQLFLFFPDSIVVILFP